VLVLVEVVRHEVGPRGGIGGVVDPDHQERPVPDLHLLLRLLVPGLGARTGGCDQVRVPGVVLGAGDGHLHGGAVVPGAQDGGDLPAQPHEAVPGDVGYLIGKDDLVAQRVGSTVISRCA
jgi:hypothetical protein